LIYELVHVAKTFTIQVNAVQPRPMTLTESWVLLGDFEHILHDWPDAECVQIFRNIRTAIGDSRGRILLRESSSSLEALQEADRFVATTDVFIMADSGDETGIEKVISRFTSVVRILTLAVTFLLS